VRVMAVALDGVGWECSSHAFKVSDQGTGGNRCFCSSCSEGHHGGVGKQKGEQTEGKGDRVHRVRWGDGSGEEGKHLGGGSVPALGGELFSEGDQVTALLGGHGSKYLVG